MLIKFIDVCVQQQHLQDQIDKLAPPAAFIKVDQAVDMSSQCVAFNNDLQQHVKAIAADSPSQLPSDCSAGGGIDPGHPHESDDAILTSALVSAVAADERLAVSLFFMKYAFKHFLNLVLDTSDSIVKPRHKLGQEPSVSKSNRLHIDISNVRYIL